MRCMKTSCFFFIFKKEFSDRAIFKKKCIIASNHIKSKRKKNKRKKQQQNNVQHEDSQECNSLLVTSA